MRYTIGILIVLMTSFVRADLSVPALSSNPKAPNTLYLDFHGEPATTWGGRAIPATPAYSTDTDTLNFSDAELNDIHSIWSVVSDAFAQFNLNVTTVDPGGWTGTNIASAHQVREVIGGNNAWTGGSFGGIAYVGSFSSTILPDTVYVFPDNLVDYAPYVANDSVHEAGHAFGLQHQSLWSNGILVQEYYDGGSGPTAPWMGNSLGKQGAWWVGQTPTGSFQNDVQVLTLTLGTVPEPSYCGVIAGIFMFCIIICRR